MKNRKNQPQNLKAGDNIDSSEATFILHSRYVKDSSFENPGAPVTATIKDPHIDIGVKINAQQGGDLYEIELAYRITGSHDDKILFHADITYAGLFEVHGASTEQITRLIYVEAPRMLYPYAARVVADMARDGGLPGLSTEEPDFLSIWKMRSDQSTSPNLTLPQSTYDSVFGQTP